MDYRSASGGCASGSFPAAKMCIRDRVLIEWICALMNGRDWIRFPPSTWEPLFALWNARALKPLFLLFCWLFCGIVIAAFADMVAGPFNAYGADGALVEAAQRCV